MDRMIFLAMTAASQNLQAQAIAANNLSNANTTGFKSDFAAFRAMPVFGDGYPSRVYAMTERPGINFRPGTFEATGNNLDIAINGEGWIAVQAADGSEAYTRAGDLQITATGQLLTANGEPVLGNGGPIAVPPNESVLFGQDGTLSIRPLGQEANTLAQVDRIRLVKPAAKDLIKGEDGLFHPRNGQPAEPDASVRLAPGTIEKSNVNSVSEMISMIENQRNYDMAVKAMHTAQENDSIGDRVLRLS
jgi:flagellar basal-body rod protein FlgF